MPHVDESKQPLSSKDKQRLAVTAATKKRKAQLASEGRCIHCGSQPNPGSKMCRACLDKQAERTRKKRGMPTGQPIQPRTGSHHSDERKQKIRLKLQGYWLNREEIVKQRRLKASELEALSNSLSAHSKATLKGIPPKDSLRPYTEDDEPEPMSSSENERRLVELHNIKMVLKAAEMQRIRKLFQDELAGKQKV